MGFKLNPITGKLDLVNSKTTPGGSDTQVQFNDSSTFGGDSGLIYNKTTDALTINGNLVNNGVAGQTNIFNENGVDQDFRIEGDTNTSLLFIDASTDRVGINTSTPLTKFHVESGTIAVGNSLTSGRLSSANGPRSFNLIDTNAVVRVWRYGGDPAVELVRGTNDDAANAANTWWDIFSSSADSMIFRRRSGNVTQEKFNCYSASVVANEPGDDVDFRVEGDTATQLLVLDAGLDAVQIGTTTAGDIADFRTGSIVINESGADRDIRMEGDTETNLLYLDAGNNRVGIGTASPGGRLSVFVDQIGDGFRVVASGSNSPQFSLYSDSTQLGAFGLAFSSGHYSAIAQTADCILRAFGSSGRTLIVNQGDQAIIFSIGSNTSNDQDRMHIEATGNLVFNENGNDSDARFEGDTDTNLLFTDASTDRVGVGTATPSTKLQVNGLVGLKGYTVATLPTGVTGAIAYATDLLTPAFLTTVVGGGAVVGPVFYNGANWVAI